MLQSMRSAAKYIWIVLIVTFIGGFLLYETSGLVGRAPVTTTTTVATVDGEEILYTAWQNAVATLEQQQQQRLGRAITLDERRTLEDQAFDELVNEVLLQREYRRRGISVSDEEIVQAARLAPPPQASPLAPPPLAPLLTPPQAAWAPQWTPLSRTRCAAAWAASAAARSRARSQTCARCSRATRSRWRPPCAAARWRR